MFVSLGQCLAMAKNGGLRYELYDKILMNDRYLEMLRGTNIFG